METIYGIVFAIGVVLIIGHVVRGIAKFKEFNAILRRDRGVTMVEYAILLAMIAIAIAIAAPNITSAVVGVFGHASSVLVKAY